MTAPYLESFSAFAADGGGTGPRWLLPLRRRALDRFALLGFPTQKNEDWHFTSVAPIAQRTFGPVASGIAPREVEASALAPFTFGEPDWPTLVFVDGRFDAARSAVGVLPEGVRVLDLRRAWREMPALVEQHLTQVASYDENAFTALNTAYMQDGAVIHLAADSDATPRPIHLLFVTTPHATSAVVYPRVLIVAERLARATIIESYAGLGAPASFTNAVTEVAVGAGATIHHLKIQRESEQAYHVGTVQARQDRDSHFISFSFASGAALSRTNIETQLAGDGAGATLNGLYMVDGAQHVDHQTRIEHASPNCFSREIYKGILDGASHGVFNGKVYVQPVAQKTDGKQSNNNLLLSDRARVDTKPQLEIFADDVKCTHGATVGRLDEGALFYLESRGIGAALARRLLTYAFAAEVLETIEVEPVRRVLEGLTLERFTGHGLAAE